MRTVNETGNTRTNIYNKPQPKIKESFRLLVKQKSLFFMSLPILVYVFIFNYTPLWGLTMAFQNFKPGKTFLEQKWIGIKNFERLFTDERFLRVIRNTIVMSSMNLFIGTAVAILLALLLNEIKHTGYKRVVQTVSYLPHFLSWIIVTGLVANFLTTENGVVNNALISLGLVKQPILWLGEPKLFWWIVNGSHIWKETGWNSIIYLATIAGISPELYEAAFMDGANRIQNMRYITLPGIKSTFIILMIMNLGFILNAGFEVQYLLGNGIVLDVSETIDIFVLKYGIAENDFSFATAAGMFKSVVSIIMISLSNFLAGKLGEEKLL